MEITVSYLAVIVAAIVSMVLGFLWYSPAVMGKPWMKLKGFTSETLKSEQKKMGKMYAISFVLALITAYVLSHMMALSMYFYELPAMQTGVTTAFWAWLGFMMPIQMTATMFGDKKWQLFGIDSGYQLLSMLAMGVVIGLLI